MVECPGVLSPILLRKKEKKRIPGRAVASSLPEQRDNLLPKLEMPPSKSTLMVSTHRLGIYCPLAVTTFRDSQHAPSYRSLGRMRK